MHAATHACICFEVSHMHADGMHAQVVHHARVPHSCRIDYQITESVYKKRISVTIAISFKLKLAQIFSGQLLMTMHACTYFPIQAATRSR